METNVPLIAIVFLAILILVVFVIVRNRKDQKQVENDLSKSEFLPDKHDPTKENE